MIFHPLQWLQDHGAIVMFLSSLEIKRSKNRVTVTFDCFGSALSVGGYSLDHATRKAAIAFDIEKSTYERKCIENDLIVCESKNVPDKRVQKSNRKVEDYKCLWNC